MIYNSLLISIGRHQHDHHCISLKGLLKAAGEEQGLEPSTLHMQPPLTQPSPILGGGSDIIHDLTAEPLWQECKSSGV